MMKIAVLVSGGGTNLQAILDAIDSGKITNTQVSVVISNNANAYALERAKKHGIPAQCVSPKRYESRELFNRALLETIQSYHVDLVVLAGCLVVIPEMMVKAYGLKVHEGVLQRGAKVTGATVHFVDEGTDTGPIILQKAVEVQQDDTPETLQRRVMEEAEWQIMPQAIDLIANQKVEITDGIVKIREA